MSTTVAQPAPLAAFVSDIHLHESQPKTTDAFLGFLRTHAVRVRQLYVLGDLFEYWAGDDDLATAYHQRIVGALRQLVDAGVALFWIAGNRDFLIGEAFADATGMTRLPDPHIAEIAGKRVALTHGDAQCTDDAAYMAFRAQVRQPDWQKNFLSMPLAQRKSVIVGMRDQSRTAQQAKSYDIMDVNPAAIASLFDSTDTNVMIHGHTHRPAHHEYRGSVPLKHRYVLPDWDCDNGVPRGGWIAMMADGKIKRFSLDGGKWRSMG